MMSGDMRTSRIASDTLFSRLLNAVWVSATSLTPASFTVSKKRSMLNDATVNSSAVADRTGVTVMFGVVAAGGEAGSVRIV